MSSKKEPEKYWFPISVLMMLSTAFVEFYFLYYFGGIFHVSLVLLIWISIFVYVLDNTLRLVEDPVWIKRLGNFHLSRIKERNVYESWYFLLILGLIFLIIVILVNLNFGEAWAIAVFGFLYGVLGLIIVDVLRYKRKSPS